MFLLRFESESVKDYILYDVPDDHIFPIISCDNGFNICYPNNNNCNIRLYFKVIFYNKSLQQTLEKLLVFINEKFNTTNENWTITKNERMLHNDHCISVYFFSNKYFINLYYLKKIVDNIFYSGIIFDISVYYTYNSKYRDIITLTLPNQSNKYFKYFPIYQMLSGNPKDLIITNLETLEEYQTSKSV